MSLAPERSRPIVLVSILLLAAVLRLPFLDVRPLWSDERKTMQRADADFPELVEDLEHSTHPPLYFWVLGQWTDLVGLDRTSLRAFSAVMGILAIPAVYGLGSAWRGPAVGSFAAFALAVSPFHIYYSQEARSYTTLALLVTGSMAGFLGVVGRRGRGAVLGYLGSSAAALYTHYWTVFLIAFQNLLAIGRFGPGDRRALGQWIGVQVALAALFLPWLPLLPIQLESGTGDWIAPTDWTALGKSFYRFVSGYGADQRLEWYRTAALAPFALLYVPLLAAGAWPGASETGREREWRIALVLWLFVPLSIAFAVSVLVKPLYVIGRYEMIVFPAFALLIGNGLARLGPRLRLAAGAGLLAWCSCFLYAHWWLRGG